MENSQKQNVRLSFEVGHKCEDAQNRFLTCDWRMWVKSASGDDISSLVEKIVFKIRPLRSIASTIKVIHEPPYYLQGSNTCNNSVNIHICIFIKVSENHTSKIKMNHYVDLKNRKKRPVNINHMHYEFVDPSVKLKELLLKCGGEVCSFNEVD